MKLYGLDGSRIAFITSDDTHGAEIFMYWVETGKVARITQLERGPSGMSWSPMEMISHSQ